MEDITGRTWEGRSGIEVKKGDWWKEEGRCRGDRFWRSASANEMRSLGDACISIIYGGILFRAFYAWKEDTHLILFPFL